jgi:MFS family permease
MTPPPLRLAWTVWGLGALLYLFAFYQRVAPAVMTDQLMADFAIGGAALGNLSAFYFYAYVAMQIPTGVLADRWGPRRVLAAGAGVVNMGPLLGGVLLQPGVGWLLDRHWGGALEGGVRVYDAAAWQAGFGLLFATVAIALVLVPFIRETHCRQVG